MALEIIKALDGCPPHVRASNLRTLVHGGVYEDVSIPSARASWIEHGPYEKIFSSDIADLILEWVDNKKTGLGTDEDLRLLATIMKINGNIDWYDPDDKGRWCSHNNVC